MARHNDHIRAEELISAYLDKSVSAEERDFFERHIASCANCRAQLEATRSMVAALRAMPAVKAPHSFVLPREMAKEPRRSFLSLYPALRLATVVAALAFVVLFAGDVLINRSGASGAPQAIPAAAPAPATMPAAAALRAAAAPTQAPAAGQAFNAATAASAELAAPTTAPAAPAVPSAGAAAKTTAPEIVTESMAMTQTTATPEATAAADMALQAQRVLKATPESSKPALAQQAAPAAEQPAAANTAEAAPASDPLRVIEIALLVLAIVLGIATLVARSKQV